MSVSGLTVNPSRCYYLRLPERCKVLRPCRKVSIFNPVGLLPLDRCYLAGSLQRCKPHLVKCSMDANGGNAVFPRINVRDPYKRLGISKEASEEEIQGARNFLMQKYAGHKPSVDSIEAAHDKIIMQKFYDRKNPKIDINKKVREVRQSKIVQAITSRFQTPSTKFIIKTALAFIVLGVLTFLYPTEEGPTLQAKWKIWLRARSGKGLAPLARKDQVGSFIFSWLFGTFLMVCFVPPMVKGIRGFEVTTSLFLIGMWCFSNLALSCVVNLVTLIVYAYNISVVNVYIDVPLAIGTESLRGNIICLLVTMDIVQI
ncbi:hypothetical protein ACFE04_000423 [Oxalis oulophora]